MLSSRINVLFMQSQTYFGADSLVHSLLMRYYDRRRFRVHVACNTGDGDGPSASLKALQQVPHLFIRPTRFGTTVTEATRTEIIKNTIRSGIPTIASLAGLVQYVKHHNIQIIHCTEKPRDAFYGYLVARASGAKCIIHLHVKAENWISPLVRGVMGHVDLLVGVSAFVADSIVNLGYPAHKTRYVLNGLDTSSWDHLTDGRAIREEFNIPETMPVMAVVSRLFPWKGHTELIKALARVKERVPQFRLLLVGTDDPRATPGGKCYSDELRQLSHELGLDEHIIFTGFRADIAGVLASADMFTMPSFEEPFGMVYLEAMAMKKPVIALDNGGAREIIEHGKSGLLSLPQDIDTLANHIITLISNPDLRRQMGEYGYTRVKQYFNPQRMANDMEHVYRSLLGLPQAALHAGHFTQ